MSESTQQLADGRVAIRFERMLRHPREQVWAAITELDQLRRWFVDILDYDRCALSFQSGAALTYVAGGEVVGHGTVTGFDPPALLEFTWDAEVLRWELAERDHGCQLIFTNIVDSQQTAEAVREGWSSALDRIATLLEESVDARD